MSAFSFTAPFITEEEEKLERAALTEAEKREIDESLYGTNTSEDKVADAGTTPDPETLERAVELVSDHLKTMPTEDTYEYYEALERVPDLVRSESNPIKFLDVENYDVWAASKRLAYYWKVRKECFGQERMFLPMTLRGAMAPDLDALRKGFIQVLPNDSNGRSVLFWDRIRSVKPVVTREEVARMIFYYCHVISKRASLQERNLIILINAKGYDLYAHFDRILSKKMLRLREAIPIKVAAWHVFSGSGTSVLSLVMPVIKHVEGKYFRHRLVLHAGSDKEILDRLALYGVTGEHLYAYVNGSYKSDHAYLNWLSDRTKVEETDQ